jgi:hypothetical protein
VRGDDPRDAGLQDHLLQQPGAWAFKSSFLSVSAFPIRQCPVLLLLFYYYNYSEFLKRFFLCGVKQQFNLDSSPQSCWPISSCWRFMDFRSAS